MERLWQAAATVQSVLQQPKLVEKAVESGLRSLFIGFETLNPSNLKAQNKNHNLNRDYKAAISHLHDLGVMINGSFVFGMDDDDNSVFDRTVEWAIHQGIETATFHILTPYPGTVLYHRMKSQERILHYNWDLYDTRHVVYQPAKMSADVLEKGYWEAYRQFYQWHSIVKGAWTKENLLGRCRDIAYSGGWKKFEFLWNYIIRAKQVAKIRSLLESVLTGFGEYSSTEKNQLTNNIKNGGHISHGTKKRCPNIQ